MPPTTRSTSAAHDASASAGGAPGSSSGGTVMGRGEGDEGSKKRKTSGEERGDDEEAEVGLRSDFFSALPMDLMYQICGHLDPGTLLAIARTSKSIRSSMLRESAEPVWRAARRSVGLGCLSGKLDEPTYAHLLYGNACQVCGRTRWETGPQFDLQVRACAKCFETNICLATAIEEKFPDLHPLTFQCCLSTPFSHKGKRSVSRKPFYWKPEVVATSALLHEIDPVEARTDRRKAHPSQAALDLQREFDEYQEAVKNDVEVFAKCADRVEKQRLKDEKERPRLRFRQIQIRLMAAGFAKKDTLATPDWVKNSSESVDDDYWLKIRDRLFRAVQPARDKRIERQRERQKRKEALCPLYRQVYSASPVALQYFFPNLGSFWTLPTIKALWYPEDAVIDVSSWPSLTPSVHRDLERQARVDRIRLFDQLARALLSIDVNLPANIIQVIVAEPSPFVDPNDESKGFAPLHDGLTDDQILHLLSSPLAVRLDFSAGPSNYADRRHVRQDERMRRVDD